jgi:hypothetical protein
MSSNQRISGPRKASPGLATIQDMIAMSDKVMERLVLEAMILLSERKEDPLWKPKVIRQHITTLRKLSSEYHHAAKKGDIRKIDEVGHALLGECYRSGAVEHNQKLCDLFSKQMEASVKSADALREKLQVQCTRDVEDSATICENAKKRGENTKKLVRLTKKAKQRQAHVERRGGQTVKRLRELSEATCALEDEEARLKALIHHDDEEAFEAHTELSGEIRLAVLKYESLLSEIREGGKTGDSIYHELNEAREPLRSQQAALREEVRLIRGNDFPADERTRWLPKLLDQIELLGKKGKRLLKRQEGIINEPNNHDTWHLFDRARFNQVEQLKTTIGEEIDALRKLDAEENPRPSKVKQTNARIKTGQEKIQRLLDEYKTKGAVPLPSQTSAAQKLLDAVRDRRTEIGQRLPMIEAQALRAEIQDVLGRVTEMIAELNKQVDLLKAELFTPRMMRDLSIKQTLLSAYDDDEGGYGTLVEDDTPETVAEIAHQREQLRKEVDAISAPLAKLEQLALGKGRPQLDKQKRAIQKLGQQRAALQKGASQLGMLADKCDDRTARNLWDTQLEVRELSEKLL